MARQLFQTSGIRRRNGQLASGVVYVVYSDVAGTVLADISATPDASATSTATVVSATSAVTVADIAGVGPSAYRFYGPDDVDTLYLGVPSDPSLGVQEIQAATDPRLDALEAGGGGSHPNLAVHDALGLATDAELTTHAADTTSVHGITDATVLATTSGVASSIITHAAATDPHADRAYARAYADSVAQGLDVKLSVRVASTANLTLSGEQTIDGVLTSADRVLVKNQTAGATNGIYVTAAGAWSRAVDADISAELSPGSFTFVEEGTVNGGTGWVQATPDPVILDTTALQFTQFSGGGSIIGGAGLLKTGNTLDVGAGTGIAVAADTVGIAPGGVTNTQVSASAGIAESKLALNFPTHAIDHASRHAPAGADPLTGYVLTGDHTTAAHDTLGLATDAELSTHAGAADPHTGYVLESLVDAKGDIIAGSADNTPAKLTAGANGYGLTADSSTATGLKWLGPAVLNVKAAPYNAVGDGTTDDTAVIQAAIDAATGVAGGGTVFFPPGNYKVTSLSWKPGAALVGSGGLGTAASATITGTAGSDILVLPGAGSASGFRARDLRFSGGRRQFSVPGTTAVVYWDLERLDCRGATDAVLYLSGQVEELRVSDSYFEPNSSGYPLRVVNSGTNPLFDKSTFLGVTFNGGVNNIRVETALSTAVTFIDCISNTPQQHAVYLDGGLRSWSFINFTTEGAGQSGTSNRTTLTGSVVGGATSGTLTSTTGWGASGSSVAIQGAGTDGRDHYTGAWTRSGTTLSWTSGTVTTVSGPNVTDAIYDDIHLANSISTPNYFMFVGGAIGGEGTGGHLRYAINNSVASHIHVFGLLTLDVPIYDPGIRVQGHGHAAVRTPSGWTSRYPLGASLFSGLGNNKAVVSSPPGRPLTMWMVDSNLDTTGTRGSFEVRRADTNRTVVFEVQDDGDVVAWGVDSASRLYIAQRLEHAGAAAGFFGTAPIAKPTITGSRTGEHAVTASIRQALAALGLATDSTTA